MNETYIINMKVPHAHISFGRCWGKMGTVGFLNHQEPTTHCTLLPNLQPKICNAMTVFPTHCTLLTKICNAKTVLPPYNPYLDSRTLPDSW